MTCELSGNLAKMVANGGQVKVLQILVNLVKNACEAMEGEGGVPHYLGASLMAPDFTLPRCDAPKKTVKKKRKRWR